LTGLITYMGKMRNEYSIFSQEHLRDVVVRLKYIIKMDRVTESNRIGSNRWLLLTG
jgi:hypothetical protein